MTVRQNPPVSGVHGLPAWLLSALQAALLLGCVALTWRSTVHDQPLILVVVGLGLAAWAVVRPDSPATLAIILLIGLWLLTGYTRPPLGWVLVLVLAVSALHHLTALRANLPRSSRVTSPYARRALFAQAALAGTALVTVGVTWATAATPTTDDLWVATWLASAVALRRGTAALRTHPRGAAMGGPHRRPGQAVPATGELASGEPPTQRGRTTRGSSQTGPSDS